jgi:2-oxoisovalerate dehydrogenase E2 component (dihydrolipoyl transacylase)
MYSFKLPDLGEGIVESEIAEWYVKPGDLVEEDQHIADVMTDKAVVEVTAPVSGRVLAVACDAGEVLAVGSELIRFETDGDQPEQQATGSQDEAAGKAAVETANKDTADTDAAPTTALLPEKASAAQGAPVTASAPNPATNVAAFTGKVLASPSVRQRARDEDIDLASVPGSGPAGRVSHKDLDAFIAAGGALVARSAFSGKQARTSATEVKVKGLRRVIAQKMLQAKRNIPHYSYVEEVDVTNLEELRAHLNANREEGQPKLTLLPFIAQALVKILPRFPHCNAHFDDENSLLTQHDAVNVGIATMTDTGLMVPVVKHCESLDVWQTAVEVARVSQAARDSKAKPEELSGSTITITSLGAIGGIATTPIINAPETAIIGVNKLQERPVVKDGAIVVRKMMNLSSSFDHRIVDGYDGAQLVQALKQLLENPGAIFV